VLKYIHRNPLRAGLVKDLEAYEWSSHRGYLSPGRRWNWLYKEFILGLLQKQKGSRLEAYRRFIGEEDGADILRIFEGKKWPSILGGAGFVRGVKERFFARLQHREVPESRVLAPLAEDILKVVCEAYGVGKDELLRSRRGRLNEARNVAIYLTRELRRAPLDDICGPFGMGRYSSASSVIGRVKVQLARDRGLEKRVQKIIGELCKRQT
jgi:putative transposase